MNILQLMSAQENNKTGICIPMEKQWRSLRLILFTDFSDQASWKVEEINFTPKQKDKFKKTYC